MPKSKFRFDILFLDDLVIQLVKVLVWKNFDDKSAQTDFFMQVWDLILKCLINLYTVLYQFIHKSTYLIKQNQLEKIGFWLTDKAWDWPSITIMLLEFLN